MRKINFINLFFDGENSFAETVLTFFIQNIGYILKKMHKRRIFTGIFYFAKIFLFLRLRFPIADSFKAAPFRGPFHPAGESESPRPKPEKISVFFAVFRHPPEQTTTISPSSASKSALVKTTPPLR